MCEANAYLVKDGDMELVLERVDSVTPSDDGLLLKSIFGEQKFVQARVKELHLVAHQILLEPVG